MNTQLNRFLDRLLVCSSLLLVWPTLQAQTILTPWYAGNNAEINTAISGRQDHALATNGGVAFASSSLNANYGPTQVNNGIDDNSANAWIEGTVNSGEYIAVSFSNAITLESIVWGGEVGYGSRSSGTWSIQYTTDASPSGAGNWTEIGQYVYVEVNCNAPMPRSYFHFAPIANVTGVRLVILDTGACNNQKDVQELEAYAAFTAAPTVTSLTGPTNAGIYSSVNFVLTSSGAESLQWTSNGVAIAGATATNFGFSAVTLNDAASYAVVLSNSFGAVTSAPIVLTATPFITPSLIGNTDINNAIFGRLDHAVVTNGGVAFASSSLTPAYGPAQVNNGTNDNSANAWIEGTVNSGEFIAVSFAGAITLESIAWDGEAGYGGRSSGTWSMQYTTDATPSAGGAWTEIAQYVYVEPTCNQPMPRSFFHFPPIANVTGVRLVILNVGACDSQKDVQELEGYSAPSFFPSITSQSSSTNAIIDSAVNFTVASTGAESFQWYSNGVAIVGADASTYGFASVTTNDAATYTVSLANSVGGVTSSPIVLTISATVPAIISITPSSSAAQYNDFNLAVISSGAATFRWTSNSVPIAGATNSAYTLFDVQTNFGAQYAVVLVNPIGAVTSAPVTLTVTTAPTYGTYQGAVFADNPIHYYPLNETNGTTAADLGSLSSGGATYNGGITLAQAPISPYIPGLTPHFDGNPGTFVDCGMIYPGTSASVEAWVNLDTGARTSFNSFLCRFDGCFEADFNPSGEIGFIAENNSNVLGQSYMPTAVSRGVWHHVVGVYGTNGSVTVYVDGVEGPDIALGGTLQDAGPTPDRVLIGATRNGTGSSFNFLGDIGQVAIYDHALSAESVRIHYVSSGVQSTPPTITSQPVGATIEAESDFTFKVGYIGLVNSFQWYLDNVAIPGATNATYNIAFAQTNSTGLYKVVLENYIGSAATVPVTLTITPAPVYPDYQAAVLADNPIHYYPLNDTSGTTAADLGSMSQPGTYTGGYILGQPSGISLGDCVHFDGQPGTFVNCGFIYPGLAASIEAWVNIDLTASNSYQAVVARWTGSFELGFKSGRYGGMDADDDLNDEGSTYMSTQSPNGVWHHIVGTFDTNGVLTTYVDGAQGPVTTLGGGLQNSGPANDVTLIGATQDGYNASFNLQGYIAQVAIYDHVLTSVSIREHYITSQLHSASQVVIITKADGEDVLTWEAYPFGYVLEYASSLDGPYQTYTGNVTRVGTNNVAVVASGMFYKLVSQ